MRVRPLFPYLRSFAFICGLMLLVGCKVTKEEESRTRKEQQAALNDPFTYGPDAKKMQAEEEEIDPTDITGGDTANLNKKLLKRDLEKVFGTD